MRFRRSTTIGAWDDRLAGSELIEDPGSELEPLGPRVVMEVMGHSQISVTMNTYGHLMPGQLGEAATAMDDVLRGS